MDRNMNFFTISKQYMFLFFIMLVVLSACTGGKPERSSLKNTDSVVVYYSEKPDGFDGFLNSLNNLKNLGKFKNSGETEIIAELIAKHTESVLYNITGEGDTQLPLNVLDYKVFYIGAPIKSGNIAAEMRSFLRETDVVDALVIPFWTGARGDYTDRFEELIFRPRIASRVIGYVREDGFTQVRDKNAVALNGETLDFFLQSRADIVLLKSMGERSRAVMQAFAHSYPDRITGPVSLRQKPSGGSDWSFVMDGKNYFYADGRFLNEDDIREGADYNSILIYNYTTDFAAAPEEENPWLQYAKELFYRRMIFDPPDVLWGRYRNGSSRSPFYERLLGAETRDASYEASSVVKFLDWSIRVHKRLVDPLARIEKRILALQEAESADGAKSEIAAWRKELDSITAWNWRNVAGSGNRSYHSYGTAVDLLMKQRSG